MKSEKRTPRRHRLKTLSDVRVFLAHVVNELNLDRMEPQKAGKMGYLLQILARVIEGNDLEARVAAIELELSNAEKQNN